MSESIGPDDTEDVTAILAENEEVFKDAKPVEGLEYLGRAIVDAQGVPSGSPANYEATRGRGAPSISETEKADIVAAVAEAMTASTDPDVPHPWAYSDEEDHETEGASPPEA